MLVPVRLLFSLPLLATGCVHAGDDGDSSPGTALDVPYVGEHAELSVTSPAGRAWKRGLVHLHSPYSHDACDGNGMPDGGINEECLQHQRDGLCATRMDFAFMTDHPDFAADQVYGDMLLPREDDELLVDGKRMTCADGHVVTLMPGIEDELMPIGLNRQVSEDSDENSRIYNDSDQEAFTEDIAAGALVMQAHTEGQDIDTLLARQAMGLTGTEMFNLHAMVDPTKREEDLGLDAYGYLDELGPFITGTTNAEPDLGFLGFYQQQDVSIERWDALNAVGLVVGTAGTDAHENAIPSLMSDGERVDSYRRGLRWFTTVLLAKSDSLADVDEAVASRRAFIAFEILGTPRGFDFHLETDAGEVEMGGDSAATGKLVVTCPTLASGSPRGEGKPDISVIVYKDGQEFQQGCGEWPVERGVYRVRVDMVPNHLTEFLGSVPTNLIKSYPWIYSGAIRVAME